jgi:predicted phosphodiesterase
MRVFATSDLHLDYDENASWLHGLSASDYQDDILILGGDLAQELSLLALGFRLFAKSFRQVLYVPGNHELWVREDGSLNSLDKFAQVCALAVDHGVSMTPLHQEALSIVPLLGWYDFSFGEPSADVRRRWMDFRACKWPDGQGPHEITDYFLTLNEPSLPETGGSVISFSHFLPRIDIIPLTASVQHRMLRPVLGTTRLDEQVRRVRSAIHVYGHSHLNLDVTIDGVRYINNAFGYPHETRIASRSLRCVWEAA